MTAANKIVYNLIEDEDDEFDVKDFLDPPEPERQRAGMSLEDKRGFITQLSDSIRDEVLAKAERMPEEWDGHELRAYMADKWEQERTSLMRRGRRLRDYRNTIAVNNL